MSDMVDIPSPCNGICRIDPQSGFCGGCLRTGDEIAAWPAADNAERMALVRTLRARRRRLGRTSDADNRRRRRRTINRGLLS